MKKVLALLCVLTVVAAAFAGADYNGRTFKDGATLTGNAIVRVHQWLTIDSITNYDKNVQIEDYDIPYTYDPVNDAAFTFFVMITNADLKVRVEGEMWDKDRVERYTYVQEGLLEVWYRFYEYSPQLATYYPTDRWAQLGEEIILPNHTSYDGENDNTVSQSMGLGFMFKAKKDLPAGEYKFVYNIIFNPTVTF